MPFTARNARYLRISAYTVLPLYIYLDDKHVDWMTDYTLQRVLEDLRPVIGPKLKAENNLQSSGGSSTKKGTVDVHRGDSYQFAYFFRKNEPHAVLIKNRIFVHSPSSAQSSKTPVVEPPQPSRPGIRKRNGVKSKSSSTKSAPRRAKSKMRTRLSVSDEDEAIEENGDEATSESAREGTARRSLRKRTLMAGGYRETDGDGDDIVMVDSDHITAEVDQDATESIAGNDSITAAQNMQDDAIVPEPEPRVSSLLDVDTEGEEEKPKLSMRVNYQGFTIYNRCLCVIIEPWPALRDRSRMRSVAPFIARDSVNPSETRESTPMVPIRERTPLFLPDLDPRQSTTPAPLPSRFLPPVPLFDDNDHAEPEDEEDATDEGGMMAFSQALKSAGGERAGSANEDENEGDVFLGDADERRGEL